MAARIITREKIETDLVHEISSFILRIGTVACIAIGIWAFTCFLSALVNYGPFTMIRSYITAVTGL